MEVFSKTLKLRADLEMGGYAQVRRSKSFNDQLEVNGWSFMDEIKNIKFELCAIDALYAGDLTRVNPSENSNRFFLASHTHYAPMIDSNKPQLGSFSKDALNCYSNAIEYSVRTKVRPDVCRIYKSDVNMPVYRRFDFPDSQVNRFLTRYGGMYPNVDVNIDRGLYIFEFAKGDVTQFVLVYHACHPVSRYDLTNLSSDYIGAIRMAIRERFQVGPCLFLLGCAGDVRPNFARKRIPWLPRNRLNWRFEPWASLDNELAIDNAYKEAVHLATWQNSIQLTNNPVRVERRNLHLLAQGDFEMTRLVIGQQLSFDFLPFEVSHYFHMEAQKKDPMHFLVSCVNDTLGYLPHPRQLSAGGYEVDGSRNCMNLGERVELKKDSLW